jgi:hypothetical protein
MEALSSYNAWLVIKILSLYVLFFCYSYHPYLLLGSALRHSKLLLCAHQVFGCSNVVHQFLGVLRKCTQCLRSAKDGTPITLEYAAGHSKFAKITGVQVNALHKNGVHLSCTPIITHQSLAS